MGAAFSYQTKKFAECSVSLQEREAATGPSPSPGGLFEVFHSLVIPDSGELARGNRPQFPLRDTGGVHGGEGGHEAWARLGRCEAGAKRCIE
jgi:hypothetical protein